MSENPAIRTPKQKRSMQKKQLILDTAKALYAESGYHSTTTNEIAKRANVSIGTLYSYFPDKEAVLLEVLNQFGGQLFAAFDFMDAKDDTLLLQKDTHKWLYKMVEGLVRLQESQKDLYREIASLRYSVPGVAAALDAQDEHIRLGTLAFLTKHQDTFSCADAEATAILLVELTGALVNLIACKESLIGRQRLMDAGIESLYKMVRK